ncbi:MAG TPA: tetratricopeptide repeat protein, partial [bacterium]|nr:tetratricopeptide repeat protein [bacterium]
MKSGLSTLLFLGLWASAAAAWAGPSEIYREYRGLKAYESKDYSQARKDFEANLREQAEAQDYFNLGNTQYRQQQFDKAKESFKKAFEKAEDLNLKEQSLYNLGNSEYRLGKLEDSIKAYEQALKLKSDDAEAQLNLDYVKRQLQQQQQKQQQQQQQQQ